MKTALILVASVVASVALHLAVITERPAASRAKEVAVSASRPVQEAVVYGKRLEKFKKKPLITAER